MAATLRRLSANDSIDAIEQALKDDGGVIVDGFLAADSIERIKSEVAEARALANPGMKHLNPAIQFFYGDKTRHVNGMAAQSLARGALRGPTIAWLKRWVTPRPVVLIEIAGGAPWATE